jgi:hypothetical protein
MAAAQPDSGYALIYRSLLDHPVFRDEPEAWAFASLILRAAWRPTRVRYKGEEIVLERGQVAISVRDFAVRWGRSKSWAQRFFDKLEEAGMVIRKRDRAGTPSGTAVNVLTICNYGKYQVAPEKAGTPAEQQPIQQRDTEQRIERRKEGKKEISPTPLASRRKANGSHKWAAGDPVPDEWVDWATVNKGWSRKATANEAQRFIDYALANGKGYTDWTAAWRNWCRSPYQKTEAIKQGALTL